MCKEQQIKMIASTGVHVCVTFNQLFKQLTCQHIVDNDGGACGQVTFMKQFCDQHAAMYGEYYAKLIQISNVKWRSSKTYKRSKI